MPLFGRIGRPGLLGAAARTAVIAGTATATAGAVRRHQFNRAEQRYEADMYQREQAQASAAGGVPPTTAPAAAANGQAASGYRGGSAGEGSSGDDLVAQLDKLAALHNQGALTDQEFAAAKAKLVG